MFACIFFTFQKSIFIRIYFKLKKIECILNSRRRVILQCIDKVDKKAVQRGPCYLGSNPNNLNAITTITTTNNNDNKNKFSSMEKITDKQVLVTDKVELVKKIIKVDCNKKIPISNVQ